MKLLPVAIKAKRGAEHLLKLAGVDYTKWDSLAFANLFTLAISSDRVAKLFQKCASQNRARSYAQFRQDLFVLFATGDKRGGYFVDFGATDGMELSNSYLLEKDYGWNGILAEPCRSWHERLAANRKTIIDKRCVWNVTGSELAFIETEAAMLSTLKTFEASDKHAGDRKNHVEYPVQTVTLHDLLKQHHAPPVIEYLSLDTEGSEFDILNSFDFTAYHFQILTVEHNFIEPRRTAIHDLLVSKGYTRVCKPISWVDDWYVDAKVLANLKAK